MSLTIKKRAEFMVNPNVSDVREALGAILEPNRDVNIIASGRVKGLTCNDGRVGFVIELGADDDTTVFEAVRTQAEAAAAGVPGVTRVVAVMTAHASTPSASDPGGRPLPTAAGGRGPSAAGARPSNRPAERRSGGGHGRLEMAGVGAVVAVASGKGGVGKSTLAANLACAFARLGRKTGLLDADVYGPSAPILFGLEGERPALDAQKRVLPLEAYGVKVMSMGFMAAADEAMIWRGPMVMSAISQMLEQVAWAPLDILVIDLPPGTGDAQLTIAQRAPLAGAVIISSPQNLALADVPRGVEMFAKDGVPILGVVENMSAAVDPDTGAVFAPFGVGGAKTAAEALGAPFLDAIPLDPALAEASDHGQPPAAMAPGSPLGRRFLTLAEAVLAAVETSRAAPPPDIVFEGLTPRD